MPIDFDNWARQSDQVVIYLVETSARRLADGLTLPLYFATRDLVLEDRYYLGCVSGLPRLTRQANDTLSPNHVPTWGELELLIEQDYRPDAYRSYTWLELLSAEWNLRGQPLTILVGGEGFAYSDFRTVFAGRVGPYNWEDTKLTLSLYDKSQDLTQKIPDYELPESPLVLEGSWNQTVPLLLGRVKNFRPILLKGTSAGDYPWKYALACHVIQAMDAVYYNDALLPSSYWQFVSKDLLPPAKNGEGSAAMETYGAYTGALLQAQWLVQISSVTALNEIGQFGPSIGLARFRWSLNNGATWVAENILTWLLAIDLDTLAKIVSIGHGTMALSGTYSSQVKYLYQIKISTEGYVGSAKFRYSRDSGVTWSAEIDIPDTDPIVFDNGQAAAFVGPAGSLGATTKIPVAASPGSAAFTGTYDTTSHRHYRVQILSAGDVGVATFQWSDNGGSSWTGPVTTGAGPIALSHGIEIGFTGVADPPPPDSPVDDFDLGDEWSMHVPAFVADDAWDWDLKEIPIPLADGVSVQFFSSNNPPVTKTPAQVIDWMNWWPNFNPAPSTGLATVDTTAYDLPDEYTHYQISITTGGLLGVAQFAWSDDDGLTWHTGVATGAGPIALSHGITVGFGPDAAAIFTAGDHFAFTVAPGSGADFALWDEWRFILGSTLYLAVGGTGVNITADVQGLISPATGAYVEKIGELIEALVVGWRGWDRITDLNQTALAAFNAAFPYQVGLLVDSPEEIGKIIDTLLTGIPAIYSLNQDDKFYLQELTAPTGPALLALTDLDLVEPPEGADGDENDNLFHRVYLKYDKNENSSSTPQAGAAPERIAWLQRDYRQISARDDLVLLNFAWAKDLGPLETCLRRRSDAQTLANKLLVLFKTKHGTRKAVARLQAFLLNLADPVSLRRSRFYEAAAQTYILLGLELDLSQSRSILTLWR